MAKKLKPSTEISKIYDHDFQFRLHFVGYFDKSKISGTNFIQDNLENFPFWSPILTCLAPEIFYIINFTNL